MVDDARRLVAFARFLIPRSGKSNVAAFSGNRMTMTRPSLVLTLSMLLPLAVLQADEAPRTFKVFILAGQSNMEGKAPNELFEHQANDEKTRALFAPLRKDGQWI